MNEREQDAIQEAVAIGNLIDVLLPALAEQAEEKQLCPDRLFQGLAATLLLNAGLQSANEGAVDSWRSVVEGIVAGICLAHGANGTAGKEV